MKVVPGMEPMLLVVGSLAVAAIARRFGWSSPLLLVIIGLAVSYIPGMPDFEIRPDLVLTLIVPPLLYSASLDSSYLGFKANVRPIALLAVVLVLVTTVTVGFVAHWLVPGLPLPSALVLGAVVAPPDAVAAVSIGRRLGLPRRIMTILTGESLVNDATALTAFKVAIAAAVGVGMSWGSALLTFLVASAGGVIVGFVLGWLVHEIRMRLADSVLESALGMVVPFAAYLLAEAVHGSGVLAVVMAGLYLGHFAPYAGFATRLQETSVWRAFDVLLESVVFALIGLNFRFVFGQAGAHGHPAASLLWPIVAVLLATMLVRLVWVFPATYVQFWMGKRTEWKPSWRNITVVAWSGISNLTYRVETSTNLVDWVDGCGESTRRTPLGGCGARGSVTRGGAVAAGQSGRTACPFGAAADHRSLAPADARAAAAVRGAHVRRLTRTTPEPPSRAGPGG